MKRLVIPFAAALPALLLFGACDDSSTKVTSEAGVATQASGVCKLSECPKPKTGIACCTPNAECGQDATGQGLTCAPNPDVTSQRECKLADCPKPLFGTACCTPTAGCGWDPLGSGLLCFPDPPPLNIPDAGAVQPLCDLSSCPHPDGGALPCCQLNGECGVDTLGINVCFPPPPPPTCDLDKCPTTETGPKACCQANGECGLDSLGIGLCFPPPLPLCDLAKCPSGDGGGEACCQLNGQCGITQFNGLCGAPVPEPTCDLAQCPHTTNGIRPCCLPNGTCGLDTLGIGFCFPPPSTLPDGGAISVPTGPPDDPSITGECPSFLGAFGPVWGCCSDYGICGTFASNTCLLPVGTQIPTGPAPVDGGTEPFLRCSPPQK